MTPNPKKGDVIRFVTPNGKIVDATVDDVGIPSKDGPELDLRVEGALIRNVKRQSKTSALHGVYLLEGDVPYVK